MSEQIAPTEAQPAELQQAQLEPEEGRNPNREAARYRTRLRETETERDALAARVEALQRREAERLAAQALGDPADLLAVGDVTLADLLTPDGDVDPNAVQQATAALLRTRPRFAKAPPPPSYDGGARATAPPQRGWANVLSGGGR